MDEQDVRQGIGRRKHGRIWAGLLLLLIGGVLLLDQMNFPLPDWLFNWHILLVALGLFVGLRHNFRGGGWLILMAVGGFFLLQDYYPETHLQHYIWPIALILAGLIVMLKPRHPWRDRYGHEWRAEWQKKRMEWHHQYGRHGRNPYGGPWQSPGGPETTETQRESFSPEDFIDTTSVLGGVHRKVVSKNFKGGDITTFMGGTEIDLTQADFTGTARLDVTQIMGGTKIIVPAHWEVRSEVTAIFAGFEDKRQQPVVTNPDKVLIIDGTSIFGGIELRNY
jgi:predicted membrane protein